MSREAARLLRRVPARGGRIRLVGLVVRGCPVGEEVECVPRGGTRFGAVGDDGLPGVGWDLQGVVLQVQVPGYRVVEWLDAAAVILDVVRGPAFPEFLAAQGQLADQFGQRLVLRAAPGLGAQLPTAWWAMPSQSR